MKNAALIITSLFFVCAGSIAAYAQAKTSEEAGSLLYKVTGNGLTQPSYIFGTFHAICPSEMVPFEKLDSYLTKSDQLMMEIDMDDSVEMGSMGKALIIPDGKTIKDFMTAEQFAKVDAMFTNLLGYPAENVKMVKPSMLMVLAITSPKAIGCTPTAYDTSLMKNAVAMKKPVVGLETVASQIKVIDSKPIDKQAKDLYEMAADPEKSIKELKNMMAVYKVGDAEKIFAVTESMMTTDKEFQRRLLDERNIAWIPKLEAAFKEKPTFVAVGAGHLGGRNGVIKLLRKKGYNVATVKL